jgi:hypothetical protein
MMWCEFDGSDRPPRIEQDGTFDPTRRKYGWGWLCPIHIGWLHVFLGTDACLFPNFHCAIKRWRRDDGAKLGMCPWNSRNCSVVCLKSLRVTSRATKYNVGSYLPIILNAPGTISLIQLPYFDPGSKIRPQCTYLTNVHTSGLDCMLLTEGHRSHRLHSWRDHCARFVWDQSESCQAVKFDV